MKTFVCMIVLGVYIGLVAGEECRDVDGCTHVACDIDYVLECVRRECTCSHHTACDTVEDCGGSVAVAAGGDDVSEPIDGIIIGDGLATEAPPAVDFEEETCSYEWHCVDMLCRCGYGFGGQGGPNGRN